MKQEELQSDNISRGFVSLIETDKRNFNRETASIIIQKFKDKARALGMEFNLTEDYLLNTPIEDAMEYCLSKLNNPLKITELSEIINIATNFDIAIVKAMAYEKLADLYYADKDFINAFMNYDTSINIYTSIDNKGKLTYLNNRIGLCKLNQLLYQEAIFYFTKALEFSEFSITPEIIIMASYNIALCHKKQNNISLCITHLNNLLTGCSIEKNYDVYISASILKANCSAQLNDIESALIIYKELMSQIHDENNPYLANIYNCLGDIYLKKNMYVESIEYFNKSQDIRANNNDNRIAHTLIKKSSTYISQHLYQDAVTIILLGLDYARKDNNIEYLLEGLNKICDLYELLGNKDKLESSYLDMFNILKNTDNKIELMKVTNKIINLYLHLNNLEGALKYSDISLEILKNNFK